MADIGSVISGGTSQFGKVGTMLLEKIMSGTIIIILVIIFAGMLVALLFYLRYLSQFIYDIEIKSLRSSGIRNIAGYKIIKDKGAFIRRRKDKTVWFRLKNQRVDLPPPPLECMQLGVKGKNFIKIFQKSDEEYYYLLPDLIDLEKVIRDGKEIMIGQERVKVIDGDVGYWNTMKKKDNKKLFDTESLLMKLLPFIVPTLMIVLVIFISYFMIQKWDVLAQVATSLERASQNCLSTGAVIPAK